MKPSNFFQFTDTTLCRIGHSCGLITPDVASLEDYYYWCYANKVGYNSNSPYGPYSDIIDSKSTSIGNVTVRGQYFDVIDEYNNAYACIWLKVFIMHASIL